MLKRQTSFPLASISKHITALALHLALTRLGLSFQTKIVDIFPELRDEDERKDIDVQEALSYRSGTSGWDEMYPPLMDDDLVSVTSQC